MNLLPSRKRNRPDQWPRKISLGRVSVTVYRRQTPSGNTAFMVSNYANRKRRFDSYPTEAEALDAANRLVRQLSERQVLAAGLTNEQASDYSAAVQALAPFAVSLPAAASTLAEALKLVGDLPNLHAAAKFYAARHKTTLAKPVADVVAELLAVKEARRASPRYLQDLRYRLSLFADAFRKDACNVTTEEIQGWLDHQKLAPQSYTNFRRVLNLLFQFAMARRYAADNPVAGVEKIRVPDGDVQIFTPDEIARLLAAAAPDFLPTLALGAFAGLRSAEIERLEWRDIDLQSGFITVGVKQSKTATRRVVPISENLAAWLAPYAQHQGKVWPGEHDALYKAQQSDAAATAVQENPATGLQARKPVKWKPNGLRHSFASYRFALTGDAGRVAGELGNSAAVVHKHYRELVKPAEAQRWFLVKPGCLPNVTPLPFAVGQ